MYSPSPFHSPNLQMHRVGGVDAYECVLVVDMVLSFLFLFNISRFMYVRFCLLDIHALENEALLNVGNYRAFNSENHAFQ